MQEIKEIHVRNKNKMDLKRQTLCLNKNQDSTVTFPYSNNCSFATL